MNPFDELEIDPRLDARSLTEKLRQKAEVAPPEERERIQSIWQKLTLNKSDRIKWAILAHPRPASARAGEIEKLKQSLPPILVRFPEITLVARDSDIFLMPSYAHEKQRPPHIFSEED